MRPAVLSPLAQKDLRSIWLYSAQQWGRKRAGLYINDIRQSIEKLAAVSAEGDAAEDYFKRLVGSHIIFYRILDHQIDVVRILHQSMDFDRHL